MSKELEALENIKREAGIPYFSTLYDIDMWREDFKTVEAALKRLEQYESETQSIGEMIGKKLKALEIIKEKGIILQFIKETYTVEQYNAGVFGTLVKPLTKEEYELLKEVLL